MQADSDGGFSVAFAAIVAPRAKKFVAITAAAIMVTVIGILLTNSVVTDYYRGAPGLEVFWDVLLIAVTPIAGVAAAIYFATSNE